MVELVSVETGAKSLFWTVAKLSEEHRMRIYNVSAKVYYSYNEGDCAGEELTLSAKDAKEAIRISEKHWMKRTGWQWDDDGNEIKNKPKWHVNKVDIFEVEKVSELDI
jgi:hypothetical protein